MTQEIIPLPEGFSYDEDYELANSVIMNDNLNNNQHKASCHCLKDFPMRKNLL